ncbi:amidohydrolase 2 [Paenibacillus curdlanolyticus YK9]|uniref:Amidohydrolase 2 n=1 Tax=Paenibacillus curdlanolyticus YK9 TaxID=717606 RepID=E0ICT5_9BACL|nr:amidohydrolase family protein [Paenibacillus curdlanolyticus]EFM09971.1 amidohydrolase 2 [Paenibacillus curdlanolyticus YK9]
MKIDSHLHFWSYDEHEYGWMSEQHACIKSDFLPKHLKPLLDRIGFDGSICVQARQTLQETEWLLALADQHPIIKGVVGWVDLCAPDIVDRLGAYAANPLLKGIRHIVQDEPDDAFLLREDFQRGIAALQPFGLAYDLLLFPKHLPYAVELVMKFPNQLFVLDHIAKPDIANRQFEPWRHDLAALAAHPNVYCKVSGMVTETTWAQWDEEDFTDYLDAVFACFGTGRVMIGSDWPVCTLSGSYERTMNIVLNYVKRFSLEEQALVLGGNCARFYGVLKSNDFVLSGRFRERCHSIACNTSGDDWIAVRSFSGIQTASQES